MTPLTGIYQIEGAGRARIIAIEGLRDLNHACTLAADMEAWPGAESARLLAIQRGRLARIAPEAAAGAGDALGFGAPAGAEVAQ